MNSEGNKKGLGLLNVFTFKNERSMCVYRETVILLHSSPPFMHQTDSSLEHMLSKHLNRMSKGTDSYRQKARKIIGIPDILFLYRKVTTVISEVINDCFCQEQTDLLWLILRTMQSLLRDAGNLGIWTGLRYQERNRLALRKAISVTTQCKKGKTNLGQLNLSTEMLEKLRKSSQSNNLIYREDYHQVIAWQEL